ncbi:MAG: helix-turn-helix transcriptional regulator [Candidatus Binataceae bacterium]|nr:helix-turn-helix transcriptional regulator [Candidatus Binataceae bacterium]
MNTSQTSFLSDVLDAREIPRNKLAYFRARLRNRLYDFIITAFVREQENGKLSRKQLAERIGRRPEQITRWLSGPSNWTLDTISDLLIAMGAEAEFALAFLKDKVSVEKNSGASFEAQSVGVAAIELLSPVQAARSTVASQLGLQARSEPRKPLWAQSLAA